ncbi:winged helix-turn-helix domain-containing protein [Shewanella indica]|uniref:winged helix-turn-helix domain-containing protein n=1 Tax=Shewanella indica TaxID=768528 RepID=UPI003999FC92
MGVFFPYTAAIHLLLSNAMQIGCCWFDADTGTLKHIGSGKIWVLSEIEQCVLSVLLSHQGKVVSRMQLLQEAGIPVNQEHLLEQAVARIRQYLGPDYCDLLEPIDRQGFLLHSKTRKSKPISLFLKGKAPWYHFFWMLLLSGLVLFFLSSRVGPLRYLETPDEVIKLAHPSGNTTFLRLYGEPKALATLKDLTQSIEGWLAPCPDSWRTISISLSDDSKVLSMVLKGESDQGEYFKAYKLTMSQMNDCAPEHTWLKEALRCD